MITGTHVLLYSTDAAADRRFFRDVLNIEPEIWPHLLHATGKISVPLYDASVVEDNTDPKCATWQY